MKWELLDSLNENGLAILNFDDKILQEKLRQCKKGELECRCKFLTYGFSKEADVQATDIKLFGLEGSEFILHYKEFSKKIKLNIAGNYNIYNSLAASAVGFALNLSIDEIAQGLENFKNILPNRMQVVDVHGIKIINDTYNANPQSMAEAIEFVQSLNNYKRKILILGDMLELGEKSSDLHVSLGEHIAKSSIDFLYTLGKDSEYIGFGAKKNGFPEEKIFHFSKKKDLIDKISLNPPLVKVVGGIYFNKEDVVFMKGSRSMGMEEIVESLKVNL